MKIIIYILLIGQVFLLSCGNSAPEKVTNSDISTQRNQLEKITFDKNLAKELGADAYGMKQYIMAFLYRGPNKEQDSARRAELQAAHLANISRLANEGKLVLAGPFLDSGDLRGIYIFTGVSLDEAKELTNSDPAIKAGTLRMELKPWYGSAAISKVNEIHKRIATKQP